MRNRAFLDFRTAGGFVLLCALMTFGSVQAQDIRTLPQGEMEVSVGGRCIVYYDNKGSRTHSQECRTDQVQRADDAVESRLRGRDDPAPEIFMGSNGEGEVTFGDTRCVVYYGLGGRRLRNLPACSVRQIRRADDEMARYRREQGLDQPRDREDRPAYGRDDDERPPEVSRLGNGNYVVRMMGDCRVYYSPGGEQTIVTKKCKPWQIRRADRAVDEYRREQGPGY